MKNSKPKIKSTSILCYSIRTDMYRLRYLTELHQKKKKTYIDRCFLSFFQLIQNIEKQQNQL